MKSSQDAATAPEELSMKLSSSIHSYNDDNIITYSDQWNSNDGGNHEIIVKSYLHNNTLHLNPFHIHQFLSSKPSDIGSAGNANIDTVNNTYENNAERKIILKKEQEEEDDINENEDEDEQYYNIDASQSVITFDNLLESLSKQCFIISEPLASLKRMGSYDSGSNDPSYNYFTIRWTVTETDSVEDKSRDLFTKFSLLSFSDTGKKNNTSKQQDESESDLQSNNHTEMKKAAARFVVHQMKTKGLIMTHHHSPPSSKTNNKIQNNESIHNKDNDKTSGKASFGTGLLYGISKKVFHKASTTFTSVLASYDLADDPILPNNNYLDDDGSNIDEDDYHLNQGVDFEVDDGEDDDANEYFATESQTNKSDKAMKLRRLRQLYETDTIWNIHLIMDCWSLILHHVKQTVSIMNDNRNDSLTTMAAATTTPCPEQLVTVSLARKNNDGSMNESVQGILLNRWGDGHMSFLKFCHNVKNSILQQTNTEKSNSADSSLSPTSSSLPTTNYPIEKIASILSNISLGISLEIIIMTLIETNNAILCSNGDVIVLFPTFYHILKGHSVANEEDIEKPTVNDVDVAVFKLNSTIQSIEKRIDTLTHHSEVMKQRALSAKQKNNNVKVALMYMKRRQIIMNEIDRCSNSLLNLEGGLHSLERARSDAQVLKAYEMVNCTMKALREETSLSHVEEVVDEFNDGNDELQHIQDSLGIQPSLESYDIEEMENELLALENDDGDGNNGYSDEKGSDEKQNKVMKDEPKEKTMDQKQHSKEQSWRKVVT